MDYLEINKNLWDKKVEIHYTSEFYNVDEFRQTKNSLNTIETDLLGDIRNKKILHLQCHFGMDTISLSKLGAVATGVDISCKAIEKAKNLNSQLKTNACFIESDVYSLHEKLEETFDIVFTSYGVVGWLPDMYRWAKTVSHFLKPGGKFVMVEFHPVIWMMSYDFKKIEFDYCSSEPIIEELSGTYTNRDANIKQQSVSWNHGMARVLDAIIKNGLVITDFQEYNYSPYNCFQNTVEVEKGKFQIQGLENKIPMLYSVVGEKKNR